MIENLDELTSEQKNDLQEFVNIAHKNKDLWWENGDVLKGKPLFDTLEVYFGDIIDVNSLNEILIDFPIADKDVNDKEKEKVLQLISADQCIKEIGFRRATHDELPQYGFRFKKYENMVNSVKQNILTPSEFDTKQLLEELQNVLIYLKTGEFDDEVYIEDRK